MRMAGAHRCEAVSEKEKYRMHKEFALADVRQFTVQDRMKKEKSNGALQCMARSRY